jgi:phage gp36-like protein
MRYATPDDLALRVQQAVLSGLSGSLSDVPDLLRLTVALEDAAAEIDGWLSPVYRLPLSAPPPVLTRIACDIALYRLWQTPREEEIKDMRRRYEDALAWLKEVRSGRITLEAAPAAPPAASAQDSAYTVRDRRFGREVWD